MACTSHLVHMHNATPDDRLSPGESASRGPGSLHKDPPSMEQLERWREVGLLQAEYISRRLDAEAAQSIDIEQALRGGDAAVVEQP